MRLRLLRPLLLLGALALFVVGCSQSGAGLVKGKVFYNDEPLAGADLEFKPEQDMSLGAFGGQTDGQGNFEIKIGKGTGMNAKPGRYVALISKGKTADMPPPDAPMTEEERVQALMKMGPGPGPGGRALGKGSAGGMLPAKYASASTSPFKVDIGEGVNDLNPFRLQGPPLRMR